MNRVKDVIDCWFDSGAMPFAQYHYPFENKKLWEEQFPADFISEGIDQTRGWFYSLLVVSVFVKGVTPYKNVLVNDLLLDKYGQKMHKSKGNAISPFETMEKNGADTVRFYMLYASPVWTPLKFDEDGLKEVYSKYISTLKNAYSFFEMYANADNIDPREYDIPVKDRELMDKWLLSKLNNLIKKVNEAYQEYDLNKAAKAIVPFFKPIGLGYWQIVVALIAGIAAKEVVVSSCSVLFGIQNITGTQGMNAMAALLGSIGFGAANAYALMVFCLLYVPYTATIATIHREVGSRKVTAAFIVFQLAVAWIVSFIIYHIIGAFL